MEEDASMNTIRWVAWGVVEVDGVMDRQQRRSILRKIRAELADMSIGFTIGGKTKYPWYSVQRPLPGGVIKKHACAGDNALKNICAWVLLEMGDHERSEDGGVRSAGAEAH
jgi:hypothetical protein